MSHKNYFPSSLRGGRPTIHLIHFILTRTPSSHKEVLDMEVQAFHERVTEKDPKLLIDHLQRMASGEAPFFSTTLSLVYNKLFETAFPKWTPLRPAPCGSTESNGPIYPTPPPQASTSNSKAPAVARTPVRPIQNPNSTGLKCRQCHRVSPLRNLREGLRCPLCPLGKKGTTLMRCASCGILRGTPKTRCEKKKCGKSFM